MEQYPARGYNPGHYEQPALHPPRQHPGLSQSLLPHRPDRRCHDSERRRQIRLLPGPHRRRRPDRPVGSRSVAGRRPCGGHQRPGERAAARWRGMTLVTRQSPRPPACCPQPSSAEKHSLCPLNGGQPDRPSSGILQLLLRQRIPDPLAATATPPAPIARSACLPHRPRHGRSLGIITMRRPVRRTAVPRIPASPCRRRFTAWRQRHPYRRLPGHRSSSR